jgi:hypothetical protein
LDSEDADHITVTKPCMSGRPNPRNKFIALTKNEKDRYCGEIHEVPLDIQSAPDGNYWQ